MENSVSPQVGDTPSLAGFLTRLSRVRKNELFRGRGRNPNLMFRDQVRTRVLVVCCTHEAPLLCCVFFFFFCHEAYVGKTSDADDITPAHMLLLFRRVRVTLCNQVLPPAEGDDAVPMSELLARAEMEAKAESASQVRAVADCMLPDALFCYAPLRHERCSELSNACTETI